MIKLDGVSKKFETKKRKVLALNNIDLELGTGLNLIEGESGSGKTTLLNIIALAISPTSGSVSFTGVNDITNEENKDSFRSNNIGYIFQDYNLVSDLTILDNIKLGLSLQNKKADDKEIISKLNEFGLVNVESAYPNDISGGQRQRVAIVRALVMDYKIILADEPTGALDEKNSIEIFKILKDISKDKTVIVVSHDIHLASSYADRIISLESGSIVNDTKVNNVANIDESFTMENKKVYSPFLSRLGLKYLNLKSVRTYFSFFIMIIAFTLLFCSISLIGYSKELAYKEGIKTENVSYGIVTKRKGNKFSSGDYVINEEEAEIIKSEIKHTLSLYIKIGSISSSNAPNNAVDFGCIANGNDGLLEELGVNYVGSLPKIDEVMLSGIQAENLGISPNNYSNSVVSIYDNNYKVSGIVDFTFENDTLNNTLIVNRDNEVFTYGYIKAVITSSSSYNIICSTIESLDSLDSNYFFKFDNVIYDSVQRAEIFNKYLLQLGAILSAIFIFLAFLLLVNMVSNSVVAKKDDVIVLKKLGCRTKNVFGVFIIQSIILVLAAMIISFGLYIYIQGLMNSYVKKEFFFLINIFNVRFTSFLIYFVVVMIVVSLSTFISIKKVKLSK